MKSEGGWSYPIGRAVEAERVGEGIRGTPTHHPCSNVVLCEMEKDIAIKE